MCSIDDFRAETKIEPNSSKLALKSSSDYQLPINNTPIVHSTLYSFNMSEVAAKAIVGAAAPGQFNAVAENLSKLGQPSGNWFAEAQTELNEFQCKGLETNLDHPIAKALHEKMEEYQKEN